MDLDTLLVRPAEAYDSHRIPLRLGRVATGLDADRRVVTLATGELVEYDHLVIATGASNARRRSRASASRASTSSGRPPTPR